MTGNWRDWWCRQETYSTLVCWLLRRAGRHSATDTIRVAEDEDEGDADVSCPGVDGVGGVSGVWGYAVPVMSWKVDNTVLFEPHARDHDH